MRQAERAIFDLRRGLPVLLGSEDGDTLVLPVEGLVSERIAEAVALAGACPVLVLSSHRLASLGMTVDGDCACLPLAEDVQAAQVIRFALARAEALAADPPPALRMPSVAESAALQLMRRAQLIPAALVFKVETKQGAAVEAVRLAGDVLKVDSAAAVALCQDSAGQLTMVSDARVPLAGLGDAQFVLFREEDGIREHVAVLLGERNAWPEAVPLRVHSACLTGDLFGSERCDCGAQLRNSLSAIHALGGGIVLYLAQEGRGIGLANKLRAYRLQDQGLDTIDADEVIGFGKDERDYRVAHRMLDALGIQRVELLTNNPEKVRALCDAGIDVSSRRALFGQLNDNNQHYLRTKADRHGHMLEELLATPVKR